MNATAPTGGHSWVPVPDGSDFTLANLPFGIARDRDGRVGVATRVGDHILFLRDVPHDVDSDVFDADALNDFAALGAEAWTTTRVALRTFLGDNTRQRTLSTVDDVEPLLPFVVADYVDFYSSIAHATNLGKLFRPDSEPLLPNWRRLPVGYHGRSASVAVSGTPVPRPAGLVAADGEVRRRPSASLDIELEVGFFVGVGNEMDRPIRPDEADRHVFGAVLVNDWSARDIQAFEYQPLGPMLGKSFLTTVSPWVVPIDALRPYMIEPPEQEPPPDPLFRAERAWGVDVNLEVDLAPAGGAPMTISRTRFADLYWTFAQQLAHLTSNGARSRTGDLFASGTVSGTEDGSYGSLIELTWRGERPLRLTDGTERSFLANGDTVTLRGWCGNGAARVGFGEATGTIVPTPDAFLVEDA